MGKQKNRRYKFHLSAKSKESNPDESLAKSPTEFPVQIKDNVFEGITIPDIFSADTVIHNADDTGSVKSYKSSKSVKGNKILPKKEKLKLRREMFLRKIDAVNQLRKDKGLNSISKKQKKEIIGDTKPLLDSLPSLDSLFSRRDKERTGDNKIKLKKAIEKSKKSQKINNNNISIYKNLMKNQTLLKNPFGVLSEHLKAVVEDQRKSTITSKKKVNSAGNKIVQSK